MSWLTEDDDEDDDKYADYEARNRPNPKGNRARTKIRPEHTDAVTGRVFTVDRGRYSVIVGEGTAEEHAALASRASELRKQPIVTGDYVDLVGDTSGDEGTLTRIVDRYLVAAFDAGLTPILCITKTDLADPTEFLANFDGLDITVVQSGVGAMPTAEIAALLEGHTTVAVGHSGVGKSTLVNALVPDANRAIGRVNAVTGRGRHTSSSTISYRVGSGWVVDTPGVRSFGLGHVNTDNILRAFTDLAAIAEDCPRGCTHLPDAPDCAMNERVAAGELGESGKLRLDSFQRLLASLT